MICVSGCERLAPDSPAVTSAVIGFVLVLAATAVAFTRKVKASWAGAH